MLFIYVLYIFAYSRVNAIISLFTGFSWTQEMPWRHFPELYLLYRGRVYTRDVLRNGGWEGERRAL